MKFRPALSSFLGEANLLPVARPDGLPVTALGPLALPGNVEGGQLLVRPEDVAMDSSGVPATVVESRGLGAYDRVILRLPGGEEILAHLPPGTAPLPGAVLRLALRAGAGHLL